MPVVLFVYYVLLARSRKLQNAFLLLASLAFYAWGEPRFVIILMVSIILNWFIAYQIDKHRHNDKFAKLMIVLDLILNLGIIFVFKYLMFSIDNINALFGIQWAVPRLALPIGISFFTFQAISYVIDVYRQDGKAQPTPFNVGLYIAFFPQLIAGPIVRYNTIAEQIDNRQENFDVFSAGVTRFIIGLAKKVLLANSFASLADYSFNSLAGSNISIDLAWIGAVAYSLQIYYDFSGYSDMAIGLGKMFGFHFEENFNYPYIAKSTSEFWRRWHISLGRWFRDYVYIPLGGNKAKNPNKVYFNLFVVWLLTGIWHGANFTFILWGLIYFVSISLEKLFKFEQRSGNVLLKRIYTLSLVLFSWVIFRAPSIGAAFDYIKCMFGFGSTPFNLDFLLYVLRENVAIIAAGLLFATPVYKSLKQYRWVDTMPAKAASVLAICFLFVAAFSFLIKGSYNPFIYFNF